MASTGIYSSAASPDLERLVQNRLKIVNQQFPASAPNTLEDFRTMADALPSIARKAAVKKLVAQNEMVNAAQAFEDNERALDWARCMYLTKNVTSSTDCPSPNCSQAGPDSLSTHSSVPCARPTSYRSVRSIYIGCYESTV